jgi:hypothetical protein
MINNIQMNFQPKISIIHPLRINLQSIPIIISITKEEIQFYPRSKATLALVNNHQAELAASTLLNRLSPAVKLAAFEELTINL